MAKYRFDQIAINSTEKKKPVEEDRFTYLGLEHLDSGTLKVTRFGSEIAPIGEKLVMHKGDVLFGKRRAYQKKVAIAPFDGIFSAHGMVLRPKEDIIDKDFFPLFISSDYFLDAAIKISVGSLSPTINWRDLKELEFELPDMDTQRKLAEVLWSINDMMEAYKRLISATDELVKSQFIERFGDFKSNPKGLEITTIDQLFSVGSSKRVFQKDWKSSGVPFYRAREIVKLSEQGLVDNELFITEEMYQEYAARYVVPQPGDIMVTGVGTLGICYLVQPKDRFYYKDGNTLCFHSLGRIDSRFVVECYKMPFIREQIKANAGGSTVGTYTIETACKTRIFNPPIEEQQEFVAFVRQSDKSKFELEQALSELAATYKRIIAENLG
jgi:type I restriction enzyme S subunit